MPIASSTTSSREAHVAQSDDLRGKAASTANKAGDAIQRGKDNVFHAVDDGRSKASTAIEQAKSAATGLAADAAGKVRDFAEKQKNAGADAMQDMARSVESAADSFEDRAPGVAQMARRVARKVEDASQDLHNSSIDQIMDNVAQFARTQPIGAIIGAFVAGIVVSRLFGHRPSA